MQDTTPKSGKGVKARGRRKKQGGTRGRRGNKEGSIYARKNSRGEVVSYRAAVTVGWKNGKQVRQSFTAPSKEAVRALMHKAQVRKQDGMLTNANGYTVGRYLDVWLQHKAGEIRPSTLDNYTRLVENHVKPAIGRERLDKLQPRHIDHLHKAIQKKGLSHRMLEYTHVVLHGALDYAVRLEMLPRNVADVVRLPRNKEHKQLNYWNPKQAAQFLASVKENRLYALFYTALTTGMRRGELVGLRWGEVDLEAGLIKITAQLTELKGKKFLSEPKTRASRRTIAISGETVEVLQNHKVRQKQEKFNQGEKWREQNLVFPSNVGTPIDSGNLSRGFHELAKRAGVPVIRLHDLRHTHASLLALKGISAKVISDRLGHTNVGFTLQVYTHVYDEQRKQAAISFQELLNKETDEQS